MPGIRYDQRVLVLVEVRGEQLDWDEAERVFDQQGWPVVTAFARGEGASRGVLSEADPARLYSVEVRFFGARNRRTERAATWRVERLARAAGVGDVRPALRAGGPGPGAADRLAGAYGGP